MQTLGDILVKIGSNEPLTQDELEEVRRIGNNIQLVADSVATIRTDDNLFTGDNEIYAGGGDVILDKNGLSLQITNAISGDATNAVKWFNGTEEWSRHEGIGTAGGANSLIAAANSITGKDSTVAIESHAPDTNVAAAYISAAQDGGSRALIALDGSTQTIIVDGLLDVWGKGIDMALGELVGNIRGYTVDALADDDWVSITPSLPSGALIFIGSTADTTIWALVSYNTATPAIAKHTGGANLDVTTGVLTGTTGVDTNFTISAHTDGKLYLENRRGGARTAFALLA